MSIWRLSFLSVDTAILYLLNSVMDASVIHPSPSVISKCPNCSSISLARMATASKATSWSWSRSTWLGEHLQLCCRMFTLKVIGPMSDGQRTNLCCIQEMMDFPGKLVRINLQSPNKNYALYRLFIFFWGSLTPGSVTVNKVEPHRFVSLPKCIVGPWIYEPLDVQLWRGTPHKEWCRFLETEQPCLDRVDIHPGF